MGRTSSKRDEILCFLTKFTAENGYAPSVREICAAVGLQSTATVHYHLNALRQDGLIEMDGMKKRTITLADSHRADRIPVVGVVTAGMPILAVENIEGYLPWDGEAGCFALRVRGHSMIGAGILDGDRVVVRPQATDLAPAGEPGLPAHRRQSGPDPRQGQGCDQNVLNLENKTSLLRHVRGEGVFVDDGFIKEKTFENQRLWYNFFFCFSKRKSCKKKTSPGGFRFPPEPP